jgi:thiamine biosynthesis protein ThiS
MLVQVNGEGRLLASGTSVAELLDALDLRPDRVAVERNGELVPRREHADTRLVEGDTVEIVTLVGGG